MSKKLSDVIFPGDKIDIKMTHEQRAEENGGQMANVFQSAVCDYVSDLVLSVSMPTQGGRMVLFQPGTRCEFVFYTRKGMYCGSGVAKSRSREENLYLLQIELFAMPKKFQRRDFFRVDYLADLQYYEIDERIALLQTTDLLLTEVQSADYKKPPKSGILKDISGGGVRFTSFCPYERGDYILLMIRLTNKRFDESFYLVCQIVASSAQREQKDTYSNRAKFIFKDLKDREKIVRFVFEEERRIRRKEIG